MIVWHDIEPEINCNLDCQIETSVLTFLAVVIEKLCKSFTLHRIRSNANERHQLLGQSKFCRNDSELIDPMS